MGNYRDARQYLTRAKREGALSAHAQSLLETAGLVLEADPLEPRLSGQERVRRALQAFTQSLVARTPGFGVRGSSTGLRENFFGK
jgi:hypothetical protein